MPQHSDLPDAGRIAHFEIDQQLPSAAEAEDIAGLPTRLPTDAEKALIEQLDTRLPTDAEKALIEELDTRLPSDAENVQIALLATQLPSSAQAAGLDAAPLAPSAGTPFVAAASSNTTYTGSTNTVIFTLESGVDAHYIVYGHAGSDVDAYALSFIFTTAGNQRALRTLFTGGGISWNLNGAQVRMNNGGGSLSGRSSLLRLR